MMSKPVVVQGMAVNDPYASSEITTPSTFVKGEKQETRCRDPIFAVLFYINVGAIFSIAALYGGPLVQEMDDVSVYSGYFYAAVITSVFALICSGLSMSVMIAIPGTLIKVSLIFSVVMTGVFAVFVFLAGRLLLGILGVVFFALSVCYARAVWPRIPFATANMVTATTAIKSNLGVVFFAYLSAAMAITWSIMWTLALIGILDKTECSVNALGEKVCNQPNYMVLFGFFLAYFFGHQVLQNTVHVICAGAVGTWWFSPQESGCCASSVTGSFLRATTTSFGSICFGSLLVAILAALKQLANQARANGDGNFLLCLAECILACLESILEYFNKWAFIYVGLYGYGYLEAGKNVFALFQNRGWDAIIADDLVGTVLFLVSLVVGCLSGVVGLILASSSDYFETNGSGAPPGVLVFFLGFLFGLVICSILMSTIGSAVNTVIVLFAEAPAEFQQNYPSLSQQMTIAWQGAYPDQFH